MAQQISRSKISPNFFSDYLDGTDEKIIDVFEDRILGWFLDWAKELNNGKEHSGFAALHLVFSYFEFYWALHVGKEAGNSGDYFRNGLMDVFPNTDPMAREIIYKSGRNGFFHCGMARPKFLLQDGEEVISLRNGNVFIDRYKFVDQVHRHFKDYISQLRRKEPGVIQNFLKTWNAVHS